MASSVSTTGLKAGGGKALATGPSASTSAQVSVDKTKDASPVRDAPEGGDGLDFRLVELMFFAYRDFVGDADQVLEKYGFGRAHHRVLHFVNRHPGLSVANLLDILRITKQSLGPVLRQLVDADLLIQQPGQQDRRQRLLFPTQNGRNLSIELTRMQSRRLRASLQGIDGQDRQMIEAFLFGLIEPEERALVEGLTLSDQAVTKG
ncbi:MAG: MarR family transcriptional regulator [Pseudomonadota bacterium]